MEIVDFNSPAHVTTLLAVAAAIGLIVVWRAFRARRRRSESVPPPAAGIDSPGISKQLGPIVDMAGQQVVPREAAAQRDRPPADGRVAHPTGDARTEVPPQDRKAVATPEPKRWGPSDSFLTRASASGPAPEASRPTFGLPASVERYRNAGTKPSAIRDATIDANQSPRWVPLNETAKVAGYTISGGVYVGTDLSAIRGGGVEPALINPRLGINAGSPDHQGRTLNYWPSYSNLVPEARAAYLEWLAAGRPEGANVGYVFLWFYGVERRLLGPDADAAKPEVTALLQELERLLDLYGSSRSFRGYVTAFLEFVRVGRVPSLTAEPTTERVGADFPTGLKVGLAKLVAAGSPIPANWALSWVLCHPAINLGRVAERCRDELRRLFAVRYEQRFGEGLVIPPNKTPLRLTYKPASASFPGPAEWELGDLPDVTRLTGPLKRFLKVAEAALEELGPFSRHVGRTDDRDSLWAASLLPKELQGSSAKTVVEALRGRLGPRDCVVLRVDDALSFWPTSTPGRISKKEAEQLAAFLEQHDLGLEPDVRFGGTNPSKCEHIALFVSTPSVGGDLESFEAAAIVLQLASAVAIADGSISVEEERHLETYLESSLHLDEAQRSRLRARLAWLLAEQPTNAGLKRKLAALTPAQREGIARFVLGVAGADGHIDATELDTIGKIYTLLGLDRDRVRADVLALSAPPGTDGPVVIVRAQSEPEHAIPARESPTAERVVLAPERIAAVLAETAVVSEALRAIFEDQEDLNVPPSPSTPPVGEEDERPTCALGGLDTRHSSLLQRLSARSAWPRAEVEALAKQFDLFPLSAIEKINEAAIEASGEPLLEGDETLELNNYALEQMNA